MSWIHCKYTFSGQGLGTGNNKPQMSTDGLYLKQFKNTGILSITQLKKSKKKNHSCLKSFT